MGGAGGGQCFVLSTSAVTNFAFRIGVRTTTAALPATAEQLVYWTASCCREWGRFGRVRGSEAGSLVG